jgi:hypothetical protein
MLDLRRFIALLLISTALSPGAWAQPGRAIATLDSSTILLGDQVRLSLELTLPAGSKVNWPMFADTLVNKVEILRRSPIDTVSSAREQYTLRQELVITSFDSGYYRIPPLPFIYHQKSDSTQYYTETEAIYLMVNTVEIDPAGDIKPIKPPLHAPLTFREIAPWLGGILLLALVIAGIILYLKRKKANQPIFQIRPKPKLPPHVIALNALEDLRHRKLWQAGRVKDFYTELTDIVRQYIEGRYHIRAMEMTTYEISGALSGTDVPQPARDKLYDTLLASDLVKFAKGQPLPMENDRNLANCVDFVMATKPLEDLRKEMNEQEKEDNTDK